MNGKERVFDRKQNHMCSWYKLLRPAKLHLALLSLYRMSITDPACLRSWVFASNTFPTFVVTEKIFGDAFIPFHYSHSPDFLAKISE